MIKMNITQLISQILQYYGSRLELVNNETLRLYQSADLSQLHIDLIHKYKPQLIHYLQQRSAYQLLERIRSDGADIELLSDRNILLYHSECISDSDILNLKRLKKEIITILENKMVVTDDCLDLYIQHEIIQIYFHRLEKHRSNLRKINGSVENALVRPKDLTQNLTANFMLTQDQAQHCIVVMVEHGIFYYDSSSKFYLFPNFDHVVMQVFKKYS